MAGTSVELTPSYKMQRDVQELIRQNVEEAKKQVIAMAVKEFEERVRKIAGQVAINIANYYSVERYGNELVIKVKIEDGNTPAVPKVG